MKKILSLLVLACTSVIVLSGFVFAGWSLNPSSVYFANVPFGETRDAQITVHNGGPYSGGGTVSLVSSNRPSWYSCVSGCSYYLDSGEEHTVTIRFTAPSCYDGGTTNSGATFLFPGGTGTYGYIGASVSGSAPMC